VRTVSFLTGARSPVRARLHERAFAREHVLLPAIELAFRDMIISISYLAIELKLSFLGVVVQYAPCCLSSVGAKLVTIVKSD